MFERGFKSWCENVAATVRKELGIGPAAALPPTVLARYMDVGLWSVEDIDGLSDVTVKILTGSEKRNWSAVTVSFGGRDAVIFNPTHSDGRWASNVMHELAHLFIGHPPSTVFVSPDGILALRSFNRKQEDEAAWLSGCLLLPRIALQQIHRAGGVTKEFCDDYGVSEDMMTYRLNVTGVNVQMKRAKARR